ncbi:MAG: NlpC/P60 family protein [Pseudomonadota bacterium]
MANGLDPRLNAFRSDLADVALKNKVEAACYVEARTARVVSHFCDALAEPRSDASLQAQFLYGDVLNVFERQNGYAWVQRKSDGYVGYVAEAGLGDVTGEPTHMVLAPRTFLYSKPDLKSPRTGYRSMGSALVVVDRATVRGTDYAILANGDAVISRHLMKIGEWQIDYVAVAETLLHTPYLWGGDTGFGIDCSGLVALSMRMCGRTVLRDSDMQMASIGRELPQNLNELRRGDLVFWKGHVGMMRDAQTLLHANGHTMNVALEPLVDAVDRIGYLYGKPVQLRRPD